LLNLHELQTQFQNKLLQQTSNIEDHIVSTDAVPAAIRIGIYSDGYYLRLLEILQLDYPALHTVLGDENFDKLGRAFIAAHPSHFRSVRWFAYALADFMRHTPPYNAQAALIELAQFEWLLAESFDAKDVKALTLEDMSTIAADAWPSLCFKLHPSLRTMNMHWNTVPIWKVIKNEEDPIAPSRSDILSTWIIWRQNLDVQFCSLAVDEAYFIDAVIKGENFSSICEGLTEWIDAQNVGMHAATLLKRFILDDLIIEVF
jgi:hypothetical protein